MLKTRLIPVVLSKNGNVVQSKGFKRHQVLGNPSTIVWRLSNWCSDELIYLDITRQQNCEAKRTDLNYHYKSAFQDVLQEVSKKCFMPLTVGGGVRTLEDISLRLACGADKVSLNTQALTSPELITEGARKFGSQCIVISIDVRRSGSDWEVYSSCGREATGRNVVEWAREVEARGAGEILLNSIDNDGQAGGYDLDLIAAVVRAVKVPVIALGGVGRWEDFAECIEKVRPSAVAAANIFQYSESSIYNAKQFLYARGLNVRKPHVQTVLTEGGV